jgi:AcrR family transcriptional regulator
MGAAVVRTGRLYEELLDAAVKLATSRLSLSIPSLRSVARECGVAASAVYRHFPSQSSLNRAIVLSIDASFVAALSAADDPTRTPPERLRRFADAYLCWGLTNPGLYQLRFESADQLGVDFVRTEAADQLLAHIDRLVHAVDSRSTATGEDLWVGLHGVVSLRIHKPERRWNTDARTQAENLLRAWGLAHG